MRIGRRGRGGAPAGPSIKPGHNRFMWDYRWANGGPLAAPGKYTVKMTSGNFTQSRTFDVNVDPGVAVQVERGGRGHGGSPTVERG